MGERERKTMFLGAIKTDVELIVQVDWLPGPPLSIVPAFFSDISQLR